MHPRSSACVQEGRGIDITVGEEATRGSAFYIIGQSGKVRTRSRAGCAFLVNILY